jgi:hypothetical protein
MLINFDHQEKRHFALRSVKHCTLVAGGSYTSAQAVAISDATAGATIRHQHCSPPQFSMTYLAELVALSHTR